jgi:hypothetical protein
MEDKVIYKCAGSCGGVSDASGVCQSESCDHSGEPLVKHIQCEDCVDKSKAIEKPQGCDCCKVAQ